MKIALLQLNLIVGDLDGNAKKIVDSVRSPDLSQVDLCVTSELSMMGYPPRDLLFNTNFVKKSWEKLKEMAVILKKHPPVLVGIVSANKSRQGKSLSNSAVLIKEGGIEGIFNKTLLPTYDVFDEDRYFQSSGQVNVFRLKGRKVGVTICEDIWNDKDFWPFQRYSDDPLVKLNSRKIDLIVNLSSSPFSIGKQKLREALLSSIARKYKVPVLYANQIGGNDDLVFDGGSCAFNAKGNLAARARFFEEDTITVDLEGSGKTIHADIPGNDLSAWQALVLGTRDYILKCGFKKALLGLSGGIDSALTAVIAAEAIGPENVLGVLMPSPFSSKGSVEEALELSRNLGIKVLTLPIQTIMGSFDATLAEAFKGYNPDITEENIQARIRGNLLMALSNKYNAILLTTGNKSELAVGYCTIYGDMSGGLAVIADVPKTMVYRISCLVNKFKNNVIPGAIIEKAPSAELRFNQKDQDSLPPYDTLDEILCRFIELHKAEREIVADGFDPETVRKVLKLVANAEFKRKQAAPGLKITDRAFGTGWRMPIASRKIF
ncbi:MAG: NAD+ synthase [bacterium]|nr:NAD+ synthase [bacterium]